MRKRMIGSRVYSARVPLLLAFCKAHRAPPQPRNESVFRCGDTTVISPFRAIEHQGNARFPCVYCNITDSCFN